MPDSDDKAPADGDPKAEEPAAKEPTAEPGKGAAAAEVTAASDNAGSADVPKAAPPAADDISGEDDEEPLHVEGAQAVHGEAAPGGLDPETIRVPPLDPNKTPEEIVFRRAVARPGVSDPIPVEDAPAPEPLGVPDGPLGEAERLLARGDRQGAEQAVTPMLSEGDDAPGDDAIAAISVRARAQLMEGLLDDARATLKDLRDDERVSAADAALSLAEGNLGRAQKRVRQAVNNRPDGLAAHYALALVRVAEGDLSGARSLFERVARSEENHAVARHQLGQLVLASGDPARTGTLFEMAMEISPTFGPPALALAEMLSDSRQYGDAMQLLTEVTERQPGLLSPRLLQLRILLDVGDVDTALTLAEAIRSSAPDHPEVLLAWSEARARTGDLDEAQAALEEARDKSTGSIKARALRLMAQVAYARRPPQTEIGITRMEEAIDASPEPGELIIELAQMHATQGDDAALARTLTLLPHRAPDVSSLLSGAVMAHNRGLGQTAISLAEAAVEHVQGTPAEGQVVSFLKQLKGE